MANSLRIRSLGDQEPVRFAVEELERYLSQMVPTLAICVTRESGYDEGKEGIWLGLTSGVPGAQLPPVTDLDLDDAISVEIQVFGKVRL